MASFGKIGRESGSAPKIGRLTIYGAELTVMMISDTSKACVQPLKTARDMDPCLDGEASSRYIFCLFEQQRIWQNCTFADQLLFTESAEKLLSLKTQA